VRRGLLVVGVLLALVGAGLLASLFYFPNSQTTTLVTNATITGIGPNESRTTSLSEVTTGSGSLGITWTGTSPANVSMWALASCQGGNADCPVGPPLATWTAVTSGHWSMNGSVAVGYLILVKNVGTLILIFSATTTERYSVTTPFLTVPLWAFMITGGLVLVAIGGIAVFLGLFLPGGVYSTPPNEQFTPPADRMLDGPWFDDEPDSDSDEPDEP
jgi:hypothetical protein